MASIPELLLPAGSFESAIAAIEGGADALYFGFGEFSARKQARNIDRLEYRRLLPFAGSRGVRLYVTNNTVILERELERLADLLVFLSRFPPDAIIVQDWGVAALVRDRFPAIRLHASTQTAVQTTRAAGLAAELGVERIILPRETSLEDIRRFTRALPRMEFELFVHGALCYSYSGLCLASGLLLGRSGNRGECAQVCRSHYAMEGRGAGASAYWFSCRDQNLSARIGDIADAGIASIKVEGRMKSPEYGYAVARLYRAHLDRLAGLPVDEAELSERAEAASIAFSRAPTEAWLLDRGGRELLDPSFPGHRGALAGRILARRGGSIVVELASSLGLHDGVLGFEGGDPSRPLAFSVSGLRDDRGGRELAVARPGSRVRIDSPGELLPGSELRRISARELDRRVPSPEEYPPLRQDIPATLLIEGGALVAELPHRLFPGDRRAVPVRAESASALPLQKANRPDGFLPALEAVFEASGHADFRLCPLVPPDATAALADGSLARVADLFVPPSMLKREKNRLYELTEGALAEHCARIALEAAAAGARRAPYPQASGGDEAPPARSRLVFPQEGLPSGLPFATPRLLRERAPLPQVAGRLYLPLAPLVAAYDAYDLLVRERVAELLGAGEHLVVGLDTLHHLALARDLAADSDELPGSEQRLGFYFDVHLYVANHWSFRALSSLPWIAGRLRFACFYLEADTEELLILEKSLEGGWPPLAPVDPAFEPPLFISAGCLRKHHAEGGRCPDSCDRRWIRRLADRERRYTAVVDECVSMLFRGSQDRV